jgi:hypothetical protein
MIKTYSEFINESNNTPPGPGIDKTISVSVSDDDIILFTTEPILSNLISNQQVSIIGNQLYYYDNDETIQKLNQFFPEKIVNTLEELDREIGHVSNETKKN